MNNKKRDEYKPQYLYIREYDYDPSKVVSSDEDSEDDNRGVVIIQIIEGE